MKNINLYKNFSTKKKNLNSFFEFKKFTVKENIILCLVFFFGCCFLVQAQLSGSGMTIPLSEF
jgi:hypothetical protein